MDPESTIATLWMLVGVGGPVAMIYGTVLLIGLEVTSTLEFVVAMSVIVASMAWMVYCTWRIRLVSTGEEAGLREAALSPDIED
jgi:hypothetical protein